jgi:PHD/YefM family antitoxin component YafN of YafNO toxin-antitoxin module
MVHIHPQFITDTAGKKLVVLPANEFALLMEELEHLDDIRIYDEAKNEDDGERISAEEVFRIIEEKRKKES